MRRTIIAATAALAAAAAPTAASAATFTGNCEVTGTEASALYWSEITGAGVCTGRLDGAPQRSYVAHYRVVRAVFAGAPRTTRSMLPFALSVLADGRGMLQLGDSPVIGFRSTQGLVGEIARGERGGRGVGLVRLNDHGTPDISYMFSGLAG